jgi:hypothetical protein
MKSTYYSTKAFTVDKNLTKTTVWAQKNLHMEVTTSTRYRLAGADGGGEKGGGGE